MLSLGFLMFVKGSLVRRLPFYGRLSWLAFPPSCQPHHHVTTTSSCQPPIIKLIRKCNSSEAGEFAGERRRAETLHIFGYCGSCISVSAVLRLYGKVVDKKCAGLWRELGFHFKIPYVKKLTGAKHFWKMRSAKCASDHSQSLSCMSKFQTPSVPRALLEDEVGKRCTRL